ncbi:MAG TPA: aldehyde reductase [Steroidobacteraceae bacterium]|jgi:nucleoside-diphosphate-sugar epimerase|nr:aldehyde reductase [Steroidobacteraceae bacterium]
MSTVLVTGGSGFIGGYCLLQLLASGHPVRTTVRNLSREGEVRATLRQAGADAGERLQFYAADLSGDAGWAEATLGCEYVLHVASPLPASAIKDENDLIVPARDGTLRVLRAARDAGVKRVVMTSSFAAIGYGHPARSAPFDETVWSNLDGAGLAPYTKSKALAERAAWDFIAREGGSLELSVVNPVMVFGPVLGSHYSTSVLILKRMLEGGLPAAPKLYFGLVDVRDVADLHLRAMTHPAARGERFLAVAGNFMSVLQVAQVLRTQLGAAAARVPRRQMPSWLLRLAALAVPLVRQIAPELGKIKNATNEKARRVLGWTPRSNEECIIAAAQSLMRYGLLKDGIQHAAIQPPDPDRTIASGQTRT